MDKEPLPIHVTIRIRGMPDGARVTLDGEPMKAPITVLRTEDPALLKVTARGYDTFEKALLLTRDQTVEVEMKKRTRAPGRRGGKPRSDKKKGGGTLLDNPFAE